MTLLVLERDRIELYRDAVISIGKIVEAEERAWGVMIETDYYDEADVTVGTERSASAHLVIIADGQMFIISSLASRQDTQIISVCTVTGSLEYSNIVGESVFRTEESALRHLTKTRGLTITKQIRAKALLGIANGRLSIVTSSNKTGYLPCGASIYTVESTEWVCLSQSTPCAYPSYSIKDNVVDNLMSYQYGGSHFYCDEVDLSRLYLAGSEKSGKPLSEFHWNYELSREFSAVGLGGWCTPLFQGHAASCQFGGQQHGHQDTREFVTLISKKSQYHPGSRYSARGLDDNSNPANEVECQLIVWFDADDGETKYATYSWRRGTVPLKWSSELTSRAHIGQATTVLAADYLSGAEKYFKNLSSRYESWGGYDPTGDITCISLLQLDEGSPEQALGDAYERLTRTPELVELGVTYCPLNWHKMNKSLGLDKLPGVIWGCLGGRLAEHGFVVGETTKTAAGNYEDFELEKHLVVTQKQCGMVRINCADSLDRSNNCSFLIAVQMCYEMLTTIRGVSSRRSSFRHQHRFESLQTVMGARAALGAPFLEVLANLFIASGDVLSQLYTGTGVAHAEVIRQFLPKNSKGPHYSNTMLSVLRRYQNVMNDQGRADCYMAYLTARNPNNVLRPISSTVISSVAPQPFDLLHDTGREVWVTPNDIPIYSIVITVSPTVSNSPIFVALRVRHKSGTSVPGTLIVKGGTLLSKLTTLIPETTIPICPDGTWIFYELPEGCGVGSEMRLVEVSFKQFNEPVPMSVGAVRILGMSDVADRPTPSKLGNAQTSISGSKSGSFVASITHWDSARMGSPNVLLDPNCVLGGQIKTVTVPSPKASHSSPRSIRKTSRRKLSRAWSRGINDDSEDSNQLTAAKSRPPPPPLSSAADYIFDSSTSSDDETPNVDSPDIKNNHQPPSTIMNNGSIDKGESVFKDSSTEDDETCKSSSQRVVKKTSESNVESSNTEGEQLSDVGSDEYPLRVGSPRRRRSSCARKLQVWKIAKNIPTQITIALMRPSTVAEIQITARSISKAALQNEEDDQKLLLTIEAGRSDDKLTSLERQFNNVAELQSIILPSQLTDIGVHMIVLKFQSSSPIGVTRINIVGKPTRIAPNAQMLCMPTTETPFMKAKISQVGSSSRDSFEIKCAERAAVPAVRICPAWGSDPESQVKCVRVTILDGGEAIHAEDFSIPKCPDSTALDFRLRTPRVGTSVQFHAICTYGGIFSCIGKCQILKLRA
eukprot:TRINITY_DN18465_c0_g1_i1.p1 TRINITY_DN18465_c0_g1~~TRINITY_DN18465_c0_g1_i1.p1  ORF type:complete len:1226 (+),score=201.02 TRINITY_DN18465_c0_g1_i1:75-3752(+)